MDEEICILCAKLVDRNAIRGVLGNPEMCSILSIATGNTIEYDPTLPNVLCRNCMLETNFRLEYQNKIYENLKKLRVKYYKDIVGDHQRAKEIEDSTQQTRPIFYMDPRTHELCRSSRKRIDQSLINALHDDDVPECSSTTNNHNNNTSSIVINDVRTIQGSPTPTQSDSNFDYNTDDADMRSVVSSSSDSREQHDLSSLLVVTHEQQENISVTESGGTIHLRCEQETQPEVLHKCSYCPKIYRRASFLLRHLRKHQVVMRAKTLPQSLSEQSEQLEQLDQPDQPEHLTQSEQLEQPDQPEPPNQPEQPQFQCSDTECCERFSSLQLLQCHSMKHTVTFPCLTCSETFTIKNDLFWHSAVCEARHRVLKDIDEGVVNVRKPMRPRTRSQSFRESSCGSSSSSQASSDITETHSLHLQRMARASNWNAEMHDNHMSESAMSDTDVSSCGTSNSDSERHRIEKEERQKFKAEKRKAKRLGVDFYKCSACSFGCRSLAETMRHEQRYHRLLLQFYCSICKDWFTTRENLMRHRKKHVDILYCDFCRQIFDSQFDLEYHLFLHYEKSFDCKFCHMSFLKTVDLDRHICQHHNGETAVKQSNMLRFGRPYIRSRPTPYSGFNSKDLIQKPSRNAKILPPRNVELVSNVPRVSLCQLGKAAGIRKPGVNMCGEHFDSFTYVESEQDDEAGRQECNAPPSSFADYTGSPLCFDRTDDMETFYDHQKSDPVDTIDDGVYDVLDDMKVFCTAPLGASSENVVATKYIVENDVIIIDDSDDEDDNQHCISLPPRKPLKKQRRVVKIDLPINIGERYIPSYEEYVPMEFRSNRYLEQIVNLPPLNQPYRFIL